MVSTHSQNISKGECWSSNIDHSKMVHKTINGMRRILRLGTSPSIHILALALGDFLSYHKIATRSWIVHVVLRLRICQTMHRLAIIRNEVIYCCSEASNSSIVGWVVLHLGFKNTEDPYLQLSSEISCKRFTCTQFELALLMPFQNVIHISVLEHHHEKSKASSQNCSSTPGQAIHEAKLLP